MFKNLLNVFRIPELRNKLLFTLALLFVYRVGFYIPLPGVDAHSLYIKNSQGGTGGMFSFIANYVSIFSGGDLTQSTIFGLGIMPYISASIIMQLLGTVVPSLEKLRKEGEPGMRKITEWTRYLTVAVCIVQAVMYLSHLHGAEVPLYPAAKDKFIYDVMWVITLTAGSVFLMWLGEQIDQFGIGNGVSLVITAGIISRMPKAIGYLVQHTSFKLSGGSGDTFGPYILIFMIASFVAVCAGAILLTQAQRRIQIQQAKHMRGRRVYGGQKQYLPLRVNHSGVMPIIFAQTLLVFPSMGFSYFEQYVSNNKIQWLDPVAKFLNSYFNSNSLQGLYIYDTVFCAMIFFFSYFWNTVQFQPKEMANQLRDYGSFIPGLRPGKRTADYLENVMNRITYVGAAFLCVIALVPWLAAIGLLRGTSDAYQATQFLGGTSLLIVISVMLDFMNRIEANLVMRNYGGFMDSDGDRGGSRARNKPSPSGPVKRGPLQPQSTSYTSPRGQPA